MRPETIPHHEGRLRKKDAITPRSRPRSHRAAAWLIVAGISIGGPPAFASEAPATSGSVGTVPSTQAAAGQVSSPADGLPGIDVSHHQGVIDWAQVAASGQRFVFAKATEGTTYVDPMYLLNRFGAGVNGIAFGAYHFARPDGEPGDAVAEADHFLDSARPAPGNLVPVLDLERTGGLTHAEVTAWALAWLDRVTERLGVRPMVYTSPSGWAARTGDTAVVAEDGYTLLWAAHWGALAPTLPAGGWAGHGWSVWQYGDCGTIPGIAGCVDVDRSAGPSLDAITIPPPDGRPPTVAVDPPEDEAEPVSVAFDEIVHGVTPDNVFVWTPRTGTYPEFSLACRSGSGVEVDCATGDVRTVLLGGDDPLIPGESYQAVVNPGVVQLAVADRGGNAAPTTIHDFIAPTMVEETGLALTYEWATVKEADALGGSFSVEREAGATASYRFRGRAVTWMTARGPAQGWASVSIDGEQVGTFNQYAERASFGVGRTIEGLSPGEHTITVHVLGRGSERASDTRVVVDGIRTAGGLVADPALEHTWGLVEDPAASGGGTASSGLAGAGLQLTFRGTGVEWMAVHGRHRGRADVYVDGTLVRTVDGFTRNRAYGRTDSVTGLDDGVHTLRIVVLGRGMPAARDTLVTLDRLTVLP